MLFSSSNCLFKEAIPSLRFSPENRTAERKDETCKNFLRDRIIFSPTKSYGIFPSVFFILRSAGSLYPGLFLILSSSAIHSSKSGVRGAVSNFHCLHWLPLAAFRYSPQSPVILIANRIAGVPEFRGYSLIYRIGSPLSRQVIPPLLS